MSTAVGVKSASNCFLPESRSSRVRSRNNWDAARCSVGRRLGLQVMSSRNATVCDRRPLSCSKSWKCFETQCRKTLRTRMVPGELTTDSFRFRASTSGGSSRGLLDAEVAIANAAAAVDVLLLFRERLKKTNKKTKITRKFFFCDKFSSCLSAY